MATKTTKTKPTRVKIRKNRCISLSSGHPKLIEFVAAQILARDLRKQIQGYACVFCKSSVSSAVFFLRWKQNLYILYRHSYLLLACLAMMRDTLDPGEHPPMDMSVLRTRLSKRHFSQPFPFLDDRCMAICWGNKEKRRSRTPAR